MKKVNKIAVVLGLLTLTFFTGAWTQAQVQQEEQIIITSENYGISMLSSGYQGVDEEIAIGYTEKLKFSFKVEQAGLMGTDRIAYSFQVVKGQGPQVRMKALFFWGNNVIVHGDEVIHKFTVGTNVYADKLWCDHGGVPKSSETSNKKWNCNFAVVFMQIKSGDEIRNFPFLFNWDDGNNDSFNYNFLDEYVYDYLEMLTPFDKEW